MFLCLVLVITGLTGCGKEEKPDNTSTPAPTVGGDKPGDNTGVKDDAQNLPDEGNNKDDIPKGEPTVIRWGHNWISEIDTTYIDPVTGKSPFSPEEMEARLYAEQQVLEKYNCKIENEFLYHCDFAAPKEEADKVCLKFECLDTLAEIRFNGTWIGEAQNIHRTYEFNVTGLLEEENHLEILFHSALSYIKQEQEKVRAVGCIDAMDGFAHIRKAHSMFGWDWGPRIPDAGIHRPVSLLYIKDARISDLYIRQHHEGGRVTLHPEIGLDCVVGEESDYCWDIILHTPEGEVTVYENSPQEIIVENPALWWPRGYGEQNLYVLEAVLKKAA